VISSSSDYNDWMEQHSGDRKKWRMIGE
jgi:hypothetical protein